MGCCFSRSDGPNSPYPGGAPPSASARAINAPVTGSSPGDETTASPSSPGAASLGHHHNRQHHPPRHPRRPLDQHINKPLRRQEWVSRNKTWTRRSLDRERADFFDTRVTGRPEVWQTLHAALEVLWEADLAAQRRAATSTTGTTGNTGTTDAAADAGTGHVRAEEDDAAVALATAQTMLTAADITLPTGNLAQGAYDALGNYYPMPEWVVSDPSNLATQEPRHRHGLGDSKGDLAGGDGSIDSDDDENDDNDDDDVVDVEAEDAERRREEKGKAVAILENQISVRARLSENSRDVVIHLSRDETVRSLARRVSEEAQFPRPIRIRIAYLGKILKEGTPLVAQGWQEGHVVNALVFDLP